jgi:uncharacterized membrane protein
MNRWLFLLRQASRQLWWRASLYALFGVLAALLAAVGAPYVPEGLADRLGGSSVEAVLTILASSLLAVATFSLGAMVTAYTSVSSSATPRAAALVTGDESTQKSLATFVGAFLYSVVGVTAINAEYYGPGGRAILFILSLAVVALVAFRLLAWVSRLTSLARLGHTIAQVEARTDQAMQAYARSPRLGGRSGAPSAIAETAVSSQAAGYVQNIDIRRLQVLAEADDREVEVLVRPGAFRMRDEPLARLTGAAPDDDRLAAYREAFSLAADRTFDQDPRYGLIVLGEIAAKALSPGINDAGTAIQVIGAGARLLDDWALTCDGREGDSGACDRLFVPVLSARDMVEDLYAPIIRDGSGDASVAIKVQKTLAALARRDGGLGEAARNTARWGREAALRRLDDPVERVAFQDKTGD